MRNPVIFASLLLLTSFAHAQQTPNEPEFPVTAELLVGDQFSGSEGIAFNGEGRLFVTANRALWEIDTAGGVRKVTELHSNLGLAAIGARDLLVADFGPTNAFRQDRNSDGMVWRITPEGEKTSLITGIGDPNFVLVRDDGSILISDDATADIFVTDSDMLVKLFSTAVNHPNGLAIDALGRVYIAANGAAGQVWRYDAAAKYGVYRSA